ncbi:MAG: hypothetical protein WKH64_17795 [Chloroflexia bacterium]
MSNERAEPARSLAASPMFGRRDAPRDSPAELAPYAGETYYRGPVVKKGTAGLSSRTTAGVSRARRPLRRQPTWRVASGTGDRALGAIPRARRRARQPGVPIADLHAGALVQLLRIVRPTSPMSLGSWAHAFGGLSGLAAVCQAVDDLADCRARRAATVFGIPAAALGGVVHTPVRSPPRRASHSGPRAPTPDALRRPASATALALSRSRRCAGCARGLEAAVGGAALAVAAGSPAVAMLGAWRRRGVSAPLDVQPLKTVYRAGVIGLGVCAAGRTRSSRAHPPPVRRSLFADAATLAGGTPARSSCSVDESAARPQDYFVLTQPDADAPWDQASEVEDGEAEAAR